VTFFATDENNHVLETLTKADFAVVDGETVVRNFRSFARSEETALDLVVLVDLSASVARAFVSPSAMCCNWWRASSLRATTGSPFCLLAGRKTMEARSAASSIRPVVLCSGGCHASDSMPNYQAARAAA